MRSGQVHLGLPRATLRTETFFLTQITQSLSESTLHTHCCTSTDPANLGQNIRPSKSFPGSMDRHFLMPLLPKQYKTAAHVACALNPQSPRASGIHGVQAQVTHKDHGSEIRFEPLQVGNLKSPRPAPSMAA